MMTPLTKIGLRTAMHSRVTQAKPQANTYIYLRMLTDASQKEQNLPRLNYQHTKLCLCLMFLNISLQRFWLPFLVEVQTLGAALYMTCILFHLYFNKIECDNASMRPLKPMSLLHQIQPRGQQRVGTEKHWYIRNCFNGKGTQTPPCSSRKK